MSNLIQIPIIITILFDLFVKVASALAQLLEEPILLSGQNQRLAALVLLYGLVDFQRDDFDEKR